MILLSVIISVSAFLIGFLLGAKRPKVKFIFKEQQIDNELEVLMKEYENFLNYDGTEQ